MLKHDERLEIVEVYTHVDKGHVSIQQCQPNSRGISWNPLEFRRKLKLFDSIKSKNNKMILNIIFHWNNQNLDHVMMHMPLPNLFRCR